MSPVKAVNMEAGLLTGERHGAFLDTQVDKKAPVSLVLLVKPKAINITLSSDTGRMSLYFWLVYWGKKNNKIFYNLWKKYYEICIHFRRNRNTE